MKQQMIRFWEAVPCGTRDLQPLEGSREFFRQLEAKRDDLEPFIPNFADFVAQRNRSVLEVGIGAATDFIRFARAGAKLTGIDITAHAVALAERRLALEGLGARVMQADSERLPFPSDSFDYVYSWGVIHHTENVQQAADEIVRVVRPGGDVCVMIYHRRSLVAAQCWLLHGLLKGRPFRSVKDAIWHHIESLGTKAFTVREAMALFSNLKNLKVTPVLTPYDVRITRSRFLPKALRRFIPSRFGWFLVIQGHKPESTCAA